MSIPTEHPFAFDPTYGYTIDDLRAVRPPATPAGFDAFWRARYDRARGSEPQPRIAESAATHPQWLVHDIAYTSTGGFEIGGWLLLPRNGEIERGLVVGHGYGGRDEPDFAIPVTATALLFPCFRGLSCSSVPEISNDPAEHVLHGIDDPQHYILGGCVDDLWLAVTVLGSLYPSIAGRIGYSGESFGGGIGALAMAFDPRIRRGQLTVPTFGNMPLWLSLPTTGSAHGAQGYLQAHPGAAQTLQLFDAAVAAARIEQPTLVAAARFDPAVAPPCQFSIVNARPPSNHHETFVLDAGHFDYPGREAQHALLTDRIQQFFGSP